MDQVAIQQFQSKILDRYTEHKRDLPRRDTFDGYKVLVSETMLQQTQVDRVIPKFHAFLDELPDFAALAGVDKVTLFRLWSGLGFNSRAVRLQQSAQKVIEEFDGELPRDREILLGFPGVGPYTSASLLAFTYNISVPVVDTNIRRVLIRELGLDADITQKELEAIALVCIPEGRSNDRHNALMDYGSLVATAKATGIKPVSKQSKFAGSPRQTRGRILKHLIHNGATGLDELKKRYHHNEFDEIIIGMARDEIIQLDGELVRIDT